VVRILSPGGADLSPRALQFGADPVRRPAWWRLALIGLVVASLVALLPLAHSSPPDPGWLAGLWDDADQDDVVVLATSATGIADTFSSIAPVPLRIVLGSIMEVASAVLPGRSFCFDSPRAPPAA